MHTKYEEFIREGSLVVMDCTVLDMMQVYDDLDNYITENEYDVRAFGYDPYNAKDFVARWESENGPLRLKKSFRERGQNLCRLVNSRSYRKKGC